jgi:hypothetical protein
MENEPMNIDTGAGMATDAAPRRRGRPTKEEVAARQAQMQAQAIERPAMRPEMREDSMERARKRAAELRGHMGDVEDGTDKFYIPKDIVPDGWVYEWKRRSVAGAEDPAYQVQLARAGWEPVPVDRDAAHRAQMPMGWAGKTIERDGMILMERPKEIVDEVRRLENQRARNQVRAKEAQIAGTPDGTFTRDDPRVAPKIKKGYEPIPVGDE